MVSIVYLSKKVGARESTVPPLTGSALISLASAVTIRDRPVQVPTGFFVDSFTDTSATLEWDDNPESDLASYTLEYTDSFNYPTTWTPVVGIVASTHTVSGLSAGVLYYFRVKAIEIGGRESAFTAEITRPLGTVLHWKTGLPLDTEGLHDRQAIVNATGKYTSASFYYVSSINGNNATARPYSKGEFVDMFNPSSPPLSYTLPSSVRGLMNNGDVVLFERGSVFANGWGRLIHSGLSFDEPWIMTAYGSGPRPEFQQTLITNFGGGDSVPGGAQWLLITDLAHRKPDRDPEDPAYIPNQDVYKGLRFLYIIKNMTFENNLIRFADNDSAGEANNPANSADNVYRRNVIESPYGHSAGNTGGTNPACFYADFTRDCVYEENVLFRPGWHPDIPDSADPTIFDHCLYMQATNDPVIAFRNVCLSPAAAGTQLRCGGKLRDCLMIDCSYAHIDTGTGGNTTLDEMSYNVFTRPSTRVNTLPGELSPPIGWGLSNQSDNVVCFRNIVCDKDAGGGDWNFRDNASTNSPLRTVEWYENVAYSRNGSAGYRVDDDSGGIPNTAIALIDIHNNRFDVGGANAVDRLSGTWDPAKMNIADNVYGTTDATPFNINGSQLTEAQFKAQTGDNSTLINGGLTYPGGNPATFTIENYMASIFETPTYDRFVEMSLAQDRGSWDDRLSAKTVNAWFRANFGVTAPGGDTPNDT